jgi:hypothetical protein
MQDMVRYDTHTNTTAMIGTVWWPSYKKDKFQWNNYLDKCARSASDFIWRTVTNEIHKYFNEFILNLLKKEAHYSQKKRKDIFF